MRFISAIFFLVCIGCSIDQESADFDALIDRLRAGTPQDEMVAAHKELLGAGLEAHPALLARLADSTPAHQNLQGAVTTPECIGDICFDVLQNQVEGVWPMSFRGYQVLNKTNVADWIAQHRSKRLREMQLSALDETLAKARTDIESGVNVAQARDVIEFLVGRRQKLAGGMGATDDSKSDANSFDF